MIELELCISTIFKPFLHHLEKLLNSPDELTSVWMSLLSVLSHLLGKDKQTVNEKTVSSNTQSKATKDLATEHLRHSVMVLISKGVLKCDDDITSNEGKDISSMTWNAISNISHCKHLVSELRQSGAN